MPNKAIIGHVVKSRVTLRWTLRGRMTDRTGHMERETAVGGEKQGQIKSEGGRCRKGQRERDRERVSESCCHPLSHASN